MAKNRDTAKIKENVVSNNQFFDCPKYGIMLPPSGDDMNTITTTDLLDWRPSILRRVTKKPRQPGQRLTGREHAGTPRTQ